MLGTSHYIDVKWRKLSIFLTFLVVEIKRSFDAICDELWRKLMVKESVSFLLLMNVFTSSDMKLSFNGPLNFYGKKFKIRMAAVKYLSIVVNNLRDCLVLPLISLLLGLMYFPKIVFHGKISWKAYFF